MIPPFKLNQIARAIILAGVATTSSYAQGVTGGGGQNVSELDTIFVTATSVGVDIKDAPASVSVITREELDRAPVNSIAEVLGTLPGVTGGFNAVGSGSKISFRGMPDKYTLILIDGKRIGNSSLLGHRPDTLAQDLNWLSPEDIERIEVVRGAMSTLYGSEAMGGVINIITKKVAPEWGGSFTSNLSLPESGDKGDTFQNSFSVSGPITERLGLRVSGSYLKRDADSSSLDKGSSGTKDDTLNAKLTWLATDNHSFTLEAMRGRSRSVEFDNMDEATSEVFGAGKMVHENFAIGHEGKFGEVGTKLDLYVNTFKNESGADSSFDGAKSKEAVLDFKVDTPLKLGVDQWLTAGFQYKKEEVENPANIGNISGFILEAGGVPVPQETNPDGWQWSVFLEDQIFLRDDLTLTLGVRGDKSDGYDLNISPRAYAVYHPTENWTIRGGVSKGYRAPNLKERSLSSGTSSMGMGCNTLIPLGYSGGGCIMVGNPELEPEKSTNYELGFAYDNAAGYNFGLTYFHSTIKDMMQNGVLGQYNGTWYTQQYNIEEGETAGLEGTFGLPLSDSLKLSGNVTYMIESKNKTTGDRLNMTPEWTANATLTWQATEKLSTYLSGQYIGSQLYAPLADNARNNRTEANYTFDIGANYNVNKNLTLRGGIQNFTNNIMKTDDDYGNGSPRIFYVGMTARF